MFVRVCRMLQRSTRQLSSKVETFKARFIEKDIKRFSPEQHREFVLSRCRIFNTHDPKVFEGKTRTNRKFIASSSLRGPVKAEYYPKFQMKDFPTELKAKSKHFQRMRAYRIMKGWHKSPPRGKRKRRYGVIK